MPSKDTYALTQPAPPRSRNYLGFSSSGGDFVCGSDAITNSYTRWGKPVTLVNAIASLNHDQRSRYLNPQYTIGSAMIWPVRTKDQPTMNQARGTRQLVADRMDLTLECIRLHYRDETWNPLSDVISAYKDFFDLFDDFKGFVDFFHFQDLVTPDYENVEFYLKEDSGDFNRAGMPATTEEYVEYRENVLGSSRSGAIGWPAGSGRTPPRSRGPPVAPAAQSSGFR